MLSTSAFFSANISTLKAFKSASLASLPTHLGGVFCSAWRILTSFSSVRTYSISCVTLSEAAPARPTLTTTAFTSADLAKFWIFFGIVAEKSSVCRWP